MEPLICQCCGLSFSAGSRGTNRNGTKNNDYCTNCYKNGEYTDHHLTRHELERRLLEMAQEHNDMSLEEARQIIRTLPDLKRWKMTNIL